ncbi:hypothetical protein BHE74_00028294 [Ensete ventricosum]|nr:hypothetical protein BHE74_00028294 [Ensete ventricosum]
MSLPRCNRPREKPRNPRSLCSEMGTCLCTPRMVLAPVQRSRANSGPTESRNPDDLLASFGRSWSDPPTTVPEMLQRANQYVAAEALVAEKREDMKHPQTEPSQGPPTGLLRRRTKRVEKTIP